MEGDFQADGSITSTGTITGEVVEGNLYTNENKPGKLLVSAGTNYSIGALTESTCSKVVLNGSLVEI